MTLDANGTATVTVHTIADLAGSVGNQTVTIQVGIFSFTMVPTAIPTIPAHTPQASPITIPPQQCPLNAAAGADHVNMLWMLGHMHSHGVELITHLSSFWGLLAVCAVAFVLLARRAPGRVSRSCSRRSSARPS